MNLNYIFKATTSKSLTKKGLIVDNLISGKTQSSGSISFAYSTNNEGKAFVYNAYPLQLISVNISDNTKRIVRDEEKYELTLSDIDVHNTITLQFTGENKEFALNANVDAFTEDELKSFVTNKMFLISIELLNEVDKL